MMRLTQRSREARQRWAEGRNRFAVGIDDCVDRNVAAKRGNVGLEGRGTTIKMAGDVGAT